MTEAKNTLQKSERKKRRIRMLLINSAAVLGALSLFGLLGFVNKKQKDINCWSVDITIEPVKGESFISENDLRKLIFTETDSIVGKKISEVNVDEIYNRLTANPFIRKSSVHTSVDGRCIVKVQQRQPIARILNPDGSGLYLDSEGYTMPLSGLHTAHVPVFTGYLSEHLLQLPVTGELSDSLLRIHSQLDDIYIFTQFINGNDFLKAQVEHVYINEEKDFEIIPRVGNHRIVVGKVENLDLKFKKLMTFYANVVNSRDVNIYRKINLDYDGQVVCVK